MICSSLERPAEVDLLIGDASKAHEQLGWKPEVTFEKGIEETIRWYLEHTEWVRHIVNGNYQDYYQRMYG